MWCKQCECVCVHIWATSAYIRWGMWGHGLIKEGFRKWFICVLSDSYICVHSISVLKHLSDKNLILIFPGLQFCMTVINCPHSVCSETAFFIPFLCAESKHNVFVRFTVRFEASSWCNLLWMQLYNKSTFLHHQNTWERAKVSLV